MILSKSHLLSNNLKPKSKHSEPPEELSVQIDSFNSIDVSSPLNSPSKGHQIPQKKDRLKYTRLPIPKSQSHLLSKT